MKIAVGFNCGCGNWIIFSSIIQALASMTDDGIDLFLDEREDDWYPTLKGFEPIIEKTKGIKKVLRFPIDFKERYYDHTFMSKQTQWCWLRERFVGPGDHRSVKHWAISYMSELTYYYNEIAEKVEYKGPVYPMYVPVNQGLCELVDKTLLPYICICDGYTRDPMKDMARKHYPYWEEVVKNLYQLYGEQVNIVLLGGKEDVEWGKIIKGDKTYVENLCGKTTWEATIGLINEAMVVCTTDTGVSHIADALRKKGVVLFGPTLVSKNGPINGTMKVIRSPMPCAPCQGTICWPNCKNTLDCMAAINPNLIVSYLRNLNLFV